MSRSTQPKAAKTKAPSVTPAVTHEIIPGIKFNDHDWNSLVDKDGSNEFVLDIVEEICSSAMDRIFEKYIQKQLVPYTVSQAKDAILQIIEWQFLARDNGEVIDGAPGWAEDEEPEPAVTDCWAQGSVPTLRMNKPQTLLEEDEELLTADDDVQVAEGHAEDVEPETPEPDVDSETSETPPENTESISRVTTDLDQEEDDGGSEPLEESDREEEEKEEDHEETCQEPDIQPQSEPEPETKKAKKKFKPYLGRIKSPGVSKMTESLDDDEMKMIKEATDTVGRQPVDPDKDLLPASCHSMIKLQAGRPPGNRDAVFDETGNLVAIYKLDPEKLPNHKVKTGFKIVDPAAEAAQARIRAMRTGKYVADMKVPKPPGGTKPSDTRQVGYTTSTHTLATTVNSKHLTQKQSKPYDVIPLPPPLIETVKVAPGVVIREGHQTKKGPRPRGKKVAVFSASDDALNPVCPRSGAPTITVAEILEHQTPVVKPMNSNFPIPPIAQCAE